MLIGNSQATSAGLSLGQNYPSLIRDQLGDDFEVHWWLASGWMAKDYVRYLDDNICSLGPDIVVMHLGIIECAQRILSPWQKKILAKLPFGRVFTRFLHHQRWTILKLRRRLNLATRMASPVEFEEAVKSIVKLLEGRDIRLLILRIPSFKDSGLDVRHPFINSDIARYNKILDAYGAIAIANGIQADDFYQQGTVHFSSAGHSQIAKTLVSRLKELLL
ncbi:MAG: hypothetical protein P8N92_04120 [Burkholderiales bacterium]|nr:hypothetical protein [Burkholderiales bacterium]